MRAHLSRALDPRSAKMAAAIALAASLAVMSYPLIDVHAAGIAFTCLNRHNATLKSVMIHSPAINYTGTGSEILAAWLWGYDFTVILQIDPAIMMNPQPDTTNGSIFVAYNVFGYGQARCYYNIAPDQSYFAIQGHPANITGYENSHQLVTFRTGTDSGQYMVSWIGP